MITMRALLRFALLLVLAAVVSTSSLGRSMQTSSKPQCGVSEPCRWAVCAWSRLRIASEQCDFVGSDCVCPLGTTCQPTNNMRPVSELIVFQFRCS